MKAKKISITSDALNELFRYEPESGKLFWRVNRRPRVKAGDEAGYIGKAGYRATMVNRSRYFNHRIIWLMVYGEIREDMEIDHKDRVRDNNRIGNLRLVTNQHNHFNRGEVKGYCWKKREGKWQAKIQINGRQPHLGYFTEEIEARNAYLEAKEKYHRIEPKNEISH